MSHRVPGRVGVALLLLPLLAGAAACGGQGHAVPGVQDMDLVSDDRVLTVCTDVPYPPYQFEDPDSDLGYAGFDIDLVSEVARRLDLEPRIVTTGFERIQSGAALESGECDLAAAAVSITAERAERVAFSTPYHADQQSVLARRDGPVRDLGGLRGRRLAVQDGSSGQRLAEDELRVEVGELVVRSGAGRLVEELRSAEVDAVLQDLAANTALAEEHDDLEVVAVLDTGEQLGLAVVPDRDDQLLAAIDRALRDLTRDGTLEELAARWFPDL